MLVFSFYFSCSRWVKFFSFLHGISGHFDGAGTAKNSIQNGVSQVGVAADVVPAGVDAKFTQRAEFNWPG